VNRLETDFLGSVINNDLDGKDAIDELQIELEDFTENETRKVFSAILELRAGQEEINASTVSAKLPADLSELPYRYTDTFGLPSYYGGQLKKASQRRALLRISQRLGAAATNPEADLDKEIDTALLSISQAQDKGFISDSISLGAAAFQVVGSLDQPPRFIPTPWPALNDLIGGLRPGALYVIGARPAVGKSLIALQLAQAIATKERPVSFFSLEMTAQEIAARALAAKTGISLDSIVKHEITEQERARLELAAGELSQELDIRGSKERTVSQFRPGIRKLRSRQGTPVAAVFVDYLQLAVDKGSSRYEQVTEASQQLKALAMELDLPLVALAQLNRESTKANREPGLADLKDSGSIEQDADVVIILSEDDYGRLVLSVQKNRQGRLGRLSGHVDKATMTLKSLVKD
jgi:replicative DNA helicase